MRIKKLCIGIVCSILVSSLVVGKVEAAPKNKVGLTEQKNIINKK